MATVPIVAGSILIDAQSTLSGSGFTDHTVFDHDRALILALTEAHLVTKVTHTDPPAETQADPPTISIYLEDPDPDEGDVG